MSDTPEPSPVLGTKELMEIDWAAALRDKVKREETEKKRPRETGRSEG
ncbi:MAG: hypothetical protein WC763_07335 [Candidatus Paceibacterota bacterium]|jgi:hypothetical protein